MSTDLFFRDTASDINPGSATEKLIALTRGAGAVSKVTNTQAGPIAPATFPVTDGAGGADLAWYSNPLSAVTISGTITINLRGLESNAMANAALSASIARTDNAGSFISTIVSAVTTNAELGTVEAAANWTPTVTSTSLSAGDRLGVFVWLEDGSGVAMASTFTVSFFYDGPTGGASGDSWVRFTETITESGGAPAVLPPRSTILQQAVNRSYNY